jgi:Domain of unknown function (DUF4145)
VTTDDRKFAPGAGPPSQILVECAECDRPVIGTTRGFVIDSSKVPDNIEPEELTGGLISRFTLIECEKKHAILIAELDTGEEPYSFVWDDPTRVFPARERQLSLMIPEQLRQIYDEARACFNAKAYTAAAVMAGRTLEATCALNGVKGRNLHQSLEKMRDAGLIDGRLWEWADTLRTVRNSAAHYDSNTVSKQDSADALAFNEALLDYLYVLSARFNALKERRAKSKPEDGSAKKTGS